MSITSYKNRDVIYDDDRTPEALAFLAEIVIVCKKHNRWLGHEDSQGSFQVVEGDTSDWLQAAAEIRSKFPADQGDYKPSQVILREVPLVGTMGKAEAEFAASMIVRTLAVRGDTWRAVPWSEIQEVIKADIAANTPPFADLIRNPFFRPDVHRLIADGYAVHVDGPDSDVAFTGKGIHAMRKWVAPNAPGAGLVPNKEPA